MTNNDWQSIAIATLTISGAIQTFWVWTLGKQIDRNRARLVELEVNGGYQATGINQLLKELREAQSDIASLERITMRTSGELRELNALREQVEAITDHIRPTPDKCRHEWQLLGHQHHLSRFQCFSCRKVVEINPAEQLAKLNFKNI